MSDLKRRLAEIDRMELPPGLWSRAFRRSAGETAHESIVRPGLRGMRYRVASIVVAFVVFVAGTVLLWNAVGPAPEQTPDVAPTVINPLRGLPGGWSELSNPPDVRSGAANVWTGSRLLVWGGYVYAGFSDEAPLGDGYVLEPVTGTAEMIPPAPLAARAFSAAAWTDSELLVWGGWDLRTGFFNDGARYDPVAGEWRSLPAAPLRGRIPFSVWTGSELIVWGSQWRGQDHRFLDGAAFDPTTNSWRSISEAPRQMTDGTAVWTGEEMVVFGSALLGGNRAETETAFGEAYDPASGTWRVLPESGLSPQASTAVWDGEQLVAWDYLNQFQAYDPETNGWTTVAHVPLDAGECFPQSAAVSSAVVGEYCGQAALYEQGAWTDITQREYVAWGFELVPADPAVLLIGADVDEGGQVLLAYRVEQRPDPRGR